MRQWPAFIVLHTYATMHGSPPLPWFLCFGSLTLHAVKPSLFLRSMLLAGFPTIALHLSVKNCSIQIDPTLTWSLAAGVKYHFYFSTSNRTIGQKKKIVQSSQASDMHRAAHGAWMEIGNRQRWWRTLQEHPAYKQERSNAWHISTALMTRLQVYA